MTRGAVALASLLVTLSHPAWWVLALASFLVRGGIVAFVLPVVVIPSPLAVSNMFAPLVVPVALGRIGPEVVALAGVAIAGLLGWLVGGGYVAAAADRALIRDAHDAAIDEGVGSRHDPAPELPDGDGSAGQILAARLVTLVPLAVAVGIGTVAIVQAAYVELVRPIDVGTPLVLRVATAAALPIAAIVVAWVLAEVLGGAAGRRIAIERLDAVDGLRRAASDLVRRSPSTLLLWLATTAILALLVAGLLAAGGLAWQRASDLLTDRTADPLALAIALLSFVAIWVIALVLTGVAAAARTVVGVFELVRHGTGVPADPGTFGAGAHGRPGDWSVGDEGGSL